MELTRNDGNIISIDVSSIALVWENSDPTMKAKTCIQSDLGLVSNVRESIEMVRELIRIEEEELYAFQIGKTKTNNQEQGSSQNQES